MLADLGAQVVTDESGCRQPGRAVPDRDSLRTAINALGKKAFSWNIDSKDGRAKFDELLAGADLLIVGTDGAMARDLEQVHRAHPNLVILSISDFGFHNDLSEWRGSDAVYQALGGHLARSGVAGRQPLLAPGRIVEQCAMVQACFVALIACLNGLKTGKGDLLDFTTTIGAAQAMDPGFGMQGSATSGVPASKLPRGRPASQYLYPILPCKDGHVRMCLLAKRQWRALFDWMGSPAEFADPRFDIIAHRYKSETLLPAVTRFFADKTRSEIERQGKALGIPLAGLASLANTLTNEQAVARQSFRNIALNDALTLPLPDGVIEIDGERSGIAGPTAKPGDRIEWLQRSETAELAWADAASDRPLAGLRVLDLGVIVVGAEQGRLLADQGADVIKIENPAFPDGARQTRSKTAMSPSFAAGHRNKRSLSLDLKSVQGRAILLEMIGSADILLSNFKPGTLDSLGLDEATLRATNPRLIMADSSAFGASGPWAGRMGYGPLVRAATGLTDLWRYPDDAASWADGLTVYPDHVAGRIGVIGVLALLIRRATTGFGGRATISQMEVMLSHLATEIAASAMARSGTPVVESAVPEFPLVSACRGDDEWCVVDPQDERELEALADLVGKPVNLADAVRHWTAQRRPMEASSMLQEAGVTAAPMLRVQEMPDFPYFHQRHFFSPIDHPDLEERYATENAPVASRNLPDPPARPAPTMGQHSREVIDSWTQRTQAEIDALEAAGTIGGAVLL